MWEWWFSGGYAVSEDGEHWERRTEGNFDEDNPTLASSAGGPGGLHHVVRDETDPDPGRRYKGLLSGADRFPAVSPDGFHWTLVDTPPIVSSDESQFTHDVESG